MTMPVIQPEMEPAVCAGCGGKILDRYYLLAVDQPWHVTCLKCAECKLPLDSEATCFARDGNIYCKEDYYRLFALKKCARCHSGISTNELVMRARDNIYHINCFTCASCNKMLTTGEHFGMKESLIFCKVHYELGLQGDFNLHSIHNNNNNNNSNNNNAMPPPGHFIDNALQHPPIIQQGAPYYNGVGVTQKGRPRKRKSPLPDSDLAHMSMCLGVDGDFTSLGHDGSLQIQSHRQKRMRTSFKHHQLRIMKSYFALNHNPDAKDLKQLAQKTGLSKRVLQVWFQNARAKYRRNVLKQDGDKKSPDHDGSSQSTGDGGVSDMDGISESGGTLMTKVEPNDMESVDFSDSNSSHSFCDLQAVEHSLDCVQSGGGGMSSSMGLTELFKAEFYD